MTINGIGRAAAAGARAFKAAAPAIVLVAAVAAATVAWRGRQGAATVPADPIEAIGKAYAAGLGDAYAGAWLEGAAALESGKAIPDALGVVAGSWQAGRVALFDRTAAPAFSKIVPENTADSDVSSREKAALAAAWRSFAAGLKSPASGK
jgi:hypothetical protein